MNCFTPSQIDVEEGTAQAFASGPFRGQLQRGGVGWKFELKAIAQLADAFLADSQRRVQFIEVPFTCLGRESRGIASEGFQGRLLTRHPSGFLRVGVLQCTTSGRLRVCCWRAVQSDGGALP
jgi:hypothetical protein